MRLSSFSLCRWWCWFGLPRLMLGLWFLGSSPFLVVVAAASLGRWNYGFSHLCCDFAFYIFFFSLFLSFFSVVALPLLQLWIRVDYLDRSKSKSNLIGCYKSYLIWFDLKPNSNSIWIYTDWIWSDRIYLNLILYPVLNYKIY